MATSSSICAEPSTQPRCSHGRHAKNAWDGGQQSKGHSGISNSSAARKYKYRGSRVEAADSPKSDDSDVTIYREPIFRPEHPGAPRLGVSFAKFVGHFNPLHLAWRPVAYEPSCIENPKDQWLFEHSKPETRWRKKADSANL
eukprot:GGOE01054379.1.p1 GENE.GGOE01054379.1~~GGOE01054379.1.p1  ORF type:complete len:158 (+),score=17.11 GGOE01054379.1:49-474(+)